MSGRRGEGRERGRGRRREREREGGRISIAHMIYSYNSIQYTIMKVMPATMKTAECKLCYMLLHHLGCSRASKPLCVQLFHKGISLRVT